MSSCSAPSSHATVGSFHIRPQIERVTRVKDKKEKTRAQLAAACSVVSRVSNCQIGQRNRQPLCHPLLPRLQTSRCSHAADRLYAWAPRGEAEIFGHFSMSQLSRLCDTRKASASVLDRRGPRSLHFSAPPREERPGGGAEFPCFFFYTACYYLSRLSNSETRGQTGSECYWAGVHADD